MKKTYLIFGLIFLFAGYWGCGTSTDDKTKEINWDGTWIYVSGGGETAGGTAIWAGWAITIDGDNCSIEANGYQLSYNITCRGEKKGNEYVIFYKQIVDGEQLIGDFDKTEPLIVLTEKNGFLITKNTQLTFLEPDISKIVFERDEQK